MKYLCKINNLKNFVVPIRPLLKHLYPLINIEEYIKWKTKSKNEKEYIYYDPWLRVHMKIKNSKILKIAKHSITIKENIKNWEKRTGLKFLSSGNYVVKNALSPIYIDIEKDEGIYYEPNIWIEHEIND